MAISVIQVWGSYQKTGSMRNKMELVGVDVIHSCK